MYQYVFHFCKNQLGFQIFFKNSFFFKYLTKLPKIVPNLVFHLSRRKQRRIVLLVRRWPSRSTWRARTGRQRRTRRSAGRRRQARTGRGSRRPGGQGTLLRLPTGTSWTGRKRWPEGTERQPGSPRT